MSVMYNSLNVDEKYASILEPNLYYGSIFVPGATCTDKYSIGPAGGIYVHKLSTSSVESGKPGRDFTDEAASDELIQIVLNNNFQKSKKIYGVQAAAVGFSLANEALSTAIQECREGWQQTAAAALIQEGTAAAATAAVTLDTLKHDLIVTRGEIVKAKGRADVVLCHPDYYGMVLELAGKDFTPTHNDRIAQSGNVGQWLGFLFIEAPGLAAAQAKYYDYSGTQKTVSFADVDYVMYNHEALSIVTNFETTRLIDSENFVGSKAQVEINSGFRVTNAALTRVRKHTAGTDDNEEEAGGGG